MLEKANSRERHYELLRLAQSEDREVAATATDTLLRENAGLLRSTVFRFRDRGVEAEDLMQIGTIGMLRAIRCFDISRGTAFSTFAVPLIVGEIRRHLRDDGMVHVSRSYKQLAAEIAKRRRAFAEREGRDPSVLELSREMALPTEEIAAALSAVAPVASLSETLYEDDKVELGERLTDEESENEPAMLVNRLALGDAIGKMPPLWRKILLMRYFRNRTQQQTADLLGLSQVKVSREEKKILSFLRQEMSV